MPGHGQAGAAPAGRVVLRDATRDIRAGELPVLVACEARWLRGCGGRRFGLLADNGVPWALTDLALRATRRLNVPLPGSFTPGQLLHALDDAGIDSVLTDTPERLWQLDPAFRAMGPSPQTGLVLLQRPVARIPAVPEGTVKITYTSGSTASPKGVCLTGRHLDQVVASVRGAIGVLGIDRHLCVLPLATLLENVAGLYVALACGARCELRSLRTLGMSYGGLDPAAFVRTIAEVQPSSLILVPELLHLLVAAAEGDWRPPGSLRFIAVGGAVVSPALLARATALGLPVFEGYGLSECGSVVSLNQPSACRPGSVGRPLPHARVRIGTDGQILVGGAVHAGYLGGPPAGGEIATGDLGEFDADGYLYVRGRLRNLIITSLGRNVSPEWVERELMLEPGIGAALVVGEARPWLTALISPARAAGERARALAEAGVARANARLPDYARVRRHALVDEPFSLANGLATANGRLRRDRILSHHARLIETLYRDAALS